MREVSLTIVFSVAGVDVDRRLGLDIHVFLWLLPGRRRVTGVLAERCVCRVCCCVGGCGGLGCGSGCWGRRGGTHAVGPLACTTHPVGIEEGLGRVPREDDLDGGVKSGEAEATAFGRVPVPPGCERAKEEVIDLQNDCPELSASSIRLGGDVEIGFERALEVVDVDGLLEDHAHVVEEVDWEVNGNPEVIGLVPGQEMPVWDCCLIGDPVPDDFLRACAAAEDGDSAIPPVFSAVEVDNALCPPHIYEVTTKELPVLVSDGGFVLRHVKEDDRPVRASVPILIGAGMRRVGWGRSVGKGFGGGCRVGACLRREWAAG